MKRQLSFCIALVVGILSQSALYSQAPTDPFTDISAPLTPTYASAAAWGDYDNDGDLDILYTGNAAQFNPHTPTVNPISKIYRNDNGSFQDISAALTAVYGGAVAWGDYDNDGDLDILLNGLDATNTPVSKVYRNDNGSFQDISAALTAVHESSVAWGDYDNDGDLDILLTGFTGSGRVSEVYRNDAGNFVNISAALIGVEISSAAWGDYDNDGDLDILLAGNLGSSQFTSKVYRNDNGSFQDISAGLTGVWGASCAWGDYDNDGDLDILLCGNSQLHYPGALISKVYRNDNGSFRDISAGLLGLYGGSAAWGDYDNDGDLDILLAGETRDSNSPDPYSKVYRNDSGTFQEVSASLFGVGQSTGVWGDYDNDGDLDILLAGENRFTPTVKIYRNNSVIANTVPAVPSNLSFSVVDDEVTFAWDKATDGQTAQNALTYNLRLGKTPSGVESVSPMADLSSGYRRVVQLGNTNHENSWTIKTLDDGTYFWSVQAIDNAFAGSPFASGQSFTICNSAAAEEVIVFNGNSQLWRVNPDGTNLQQIPISGGLSVYSASISPDGSKIAISLNDATLWRINADGTNPIQLTTNGSGDNSWSPDGKKISYIATAVCNEDVWIANSDGSGASPFIDGSVGGVSGSVTHFADWSSTNIIAFDGFACGRPCDGALLYTINPDKTGLQQIITSSGGYSNWSPDGSKLTYHSCGNIYVANANGSNATQLTTYGDSGYPCWSPDGTKIAFFRDIINNIWTMNADGSNQQQITFGSYPNAQPDWGIIRTGGTLPALTANAGSDKEICLNQTVTIGGNPTATGGTEPYTFSWTPTDGLDDPFAENPTASPATTTEYNVEVTDANGCKVTDKVTVTVNPLPAVTFNPVGPFLVTDAPVDLSSAVSPAGGSFSGPGISGTMFDPAAADVGTHQVTYTFTDANGCTNSASQDIGVMVHNVVFLANDFVTLDRHGVSEGDIHSNNAIQFKKGAPSVYTGNLTAADHITIHTKNTLYGNLMASNEIVVENGAVINGNVSPNTPAATIALPNPSFTAGGSNYTVAANRSLNLLPGYYGTVTLDKNSTLYLSSGNYFFKALDTGVKSVLSLDVSGGAVNINVVDKLDFDKQMKVMTSSGDAGSSLVNFATLQESRLMVGEKARVLGSIIAPEAAIRLSKNSRFKGSICAEEIVVLQGAVFLPHSSSTPLPTIQNITDFEDIDTEETTTSVVTDYELVGNYPNPFNPSTTITFAMPEAGRVTLKIFSETGQLVRTLINGEKPPGQHNVSWNGRNDAGTAVASGMYFYQIVMQKQNGEAAFTETRRMTLVK